MYIRFVVDFYDVNTLCNIRKNQQFSDNYAPGFQMADNLMHEY